MKSPLLSVPPDQPTLVKSLLLSPSFRLHLANQKGAPQIDWEQVRKDEQLPLSVHAWATRHFLLDFTQFWAHGRIDQCTVTTPVHSCDVAENVFDAIPGRGHLTHLQVLVGSRTLSAVVNVPIPVLAKGPNAAAVNFMRRARFFSLNQDRFPPSVVLGGTEFRIFYRDANDPAQPRPRDMRAEACRHAQNVCGVLFTLRTADQQGFKLTPRAQVIAVATALRWCEAPDADMAKYRMPEGLAHLLFDPCATDAFSFGVKLATTHALDEIRRRPSPLPLFELNAINHETEQEPDDLLPFSLELWADLLFAAELLAPVWRTHRVELAEALRVLKGRFSTSGTEPAAGPQEPCFSERELHGLPDPEGWIPPRL